MMETGPYCKGKQQHDVDYYVNTGEHETKFAKDLQREMTNLECTDKKKEENYKKTGFQAEFEEIEPRKDLMKVLVSVVSKTEAYALMIDRAVKELVFEMNLREQADWFSKQPETYMFHKEYVEAGVILETNHQPYDLAVNQPDDPRTLKDLDIRGNLQVVPKETYQENTPKRTVARQSETKLRQVEVKGTTMSVDFGDGTKTEAKTKAEDYVTYTPGVRTGATEISIGHTDATKIFETYQDPKWIPVKRYFGSDIAPRESDCRQNNSRVLDGPLRQIHGQQCEIRATKNQMAIIAVRSGHVYYHIHDSDFTGRFYANVEFTASGGVEMAKIYATDAEFLFIGRDCTVTPEEPVDKILTAILMHNSLPNKIGVERVFKNANDYYKRLLNDPDNVLKGRTWAVQALSFDGEWYIDGPYTTKMITPSTKKGEIQNFFTDDLLFDDIENPWLPQFCIEYKKGWLPTRFSTRMPETYKRSQYSNIAMTQATDQERWQVIKLWHNMEQSSWEAGKLPEQPNTERERRFWELSATERRELDFGELKLE